MNILVIGILISLLLILLLVYYYLFALSDTPEVYLTALPISENLNSVVVAFDKNARVATVDEIFAERELGMSVTSQDIINTVAYAITPQGIQLVNIYSKKYKDNNNFNADDGKPFVSQIKSLSGEMPIPVGPVFVYGRKPLFQYFNYINSDRRKAPSARSMLPYKYNNNGTIQWSKFS